MATHPAKKGIPRKRHPLGFLIPPSYRARTVFGTGLALVFVLAVTAAICFWQTPSPDPRLVYIAVGEYQALPYPPLPHVRTDQLALARAEFFRPRGRVLCLDPGQASFLRQLDQLKNIASPLVISLTARALRAGKGEIYLLPRDASPEKRSTWVPLTAVLGRLKNCSSPRKLLLLDIAHPPADARLGMVTADVAAAVADEIKAVRDGRLLVLSACAPGQVSLSSDALGRSVFSYYVEQALRGWADGCGAHRDRDGQVSVRELAAFVKARGDRWARQNQGRLQTPMLLGTGEDFPICRVIETKRDEPVPFAEPRPYPAALRQAWQLHEENHKSGTWRQTPHEHRQQTALLLRADHGWRGGTSIGRLRACELALFDKIQKDLTSKQRFAKPRPVSLAAAKRKNLSPIKTTLTRTWQQLARADKTWTGAKHEVYRKQLAETFLKAVEAEPFVAVAAAVFAHAASLSAPSIEQLRWLDDVVQARSLNQPWYTETLLLHQLARSPAALARPATLRACLLRTTRLAETTLASPFAILWNKALVEKAEQHRLEGEMCFWANGFAPAAAATAALGQATKHWETIATDNTRLAKTAALLDEAVWFLPFYLAYLDSHNNQEATWLATVRLADKLYSELLARRTGTKDVRDTLDRLEHYRRALRQHLEKLQQPFRPANVERLLKLANTGEVRSAVWRELTALLQSPFIPVARREQLLQARTELEKRLHALTADMDTKSNARGDCRVTILAHEHERLVHQQKQQGHRRVRRLLELFKLSGFDHVMMAELRKAHKQAAAPDTTALKRDRESFMGNPLEAVPVKDSRPLINARQWYDLSDRLQKTWTDGFRRQYRQDPSPAYRDRLLRLFPPLAGTPVVESRWLTDAVLMSRLHEKERWSWLADHYRFRARAFRGSALPGETPRVFGEFFAQSAAVYHTFGSPKPADYLELQQIVPVPYLSPGRRSVRSELSVRLHRQGGASFSKAVRLNMIVPGKNANERLRVVTETEALAKLALVQAGTHAVKVPFTVGLPARTVNEPLDGRGFLVCARLGRRQFYHCIEVPLLRKDPIQLAISTNAERAEPSLQVLRLEPRDNVPRGFYLHVHNSLDEARAVLVQIRHQGKLLKGGETRVLAKPARSIRVDFSTATGKTMTQMAGPLQLFLLDADSQTLLLQREFKVTLVSAHTLAKPTIKIQAPQTVKVGATVKIALSIRHAPPGAKLEVRLGHMAKEKFVGQRKRVFLSLGKKTLDVRLDRKGLFFVPRGAAWQGTLRSIFTAEMNTAHAHLIDEFGTVLQEVTQSLVVDNTPPEKVSFVNLPGRIRKGSKLLVRATGGDPQSDVADVSFYLSAIKASKLPTSKPYRGQLLEGTKVKTWVSQIVLPDRAGPTPITVVMKNHAGLMTFQTVTITLTDGEPAGR